MACSVVINDKKYNDILGQVNDPVLSLKLYLQEDSNDNILTAESLPAEKRVLNLLENRLMKIAQRISGKEDNRFNLKDEKAKIEALVKKLNEELLLNNTGYFYTTALDYLKEIETNIDNLTQDQAKSYYTVTKLFSDFARNFSGNANELMIDSEISLKSKELTLKLEPIILKMALSNAADRGFDLDASNLTRMDEANLANAWTLDLSVDHNEYLQYVNKFVKEQTALRDFKLQEEISTMKRLRGNKSLDRVSRMFKKGLNGKPLFNMLITRQSDAFYKDYYTLLKAVNKAREENKWTEFFDERKKFVKWMSANTVIVDVQYHIASDNAQKEKIFKDLVQQVGNEEYAQELINQSANKWNSYQAAFEDWKEYVSSKTDKTDEEKSEMIRAWEVSNSPDIYYNITYGEKGKQDEYVKKYNINGRDYFNDNYITFTPRIDKPQYNSAEYAALEQDKELFEYYKYMKNTMNKYKRYLPDYATESAKRSDYMFRAKGDLVNAYQTSGLKGVMANLNDKLINAFTTEFEKEFIPELNSLGEVVGSIPIMKLLNIDEEIATIEWKLKKAGLADVEKQILEKRLEELLTMYSSDPSRSMEVFLQLALNYKFMSDIEDEVQLASEIVNNAKSVDKNGVIGNPKAMKDRFNHTIASVMHADSAEVEGQYKSKEKYQDNIFAVSDLVGIESDKKKKAKILSKAIKENEKVVTDLIIKEDRGQELTPEERNKVLEYRNLIKQYNLLEGKRSTLSSILDIAIQWTGLKTFAINPLSGVSNISFGLTTVLNEASGNVHFSNKDVRGAFSVMLEASKKYMSAGLVTTQKNMKITTLIEKFGLVEDVQDIKHKTSLNKSNLEKIADPYTFLTSSDFFMKGVTSVAAMKSSNKYTIETLDGNKLPIWECFNEVGQFRKELFDEKTNFEWDGDSLVGGSTKLAEYRTYLKAINTMLHGSFDRVDAILAKRYVMGRLLGQYKLSWGARMVHQRFSDKMYSSVLGEYTEGRYTTLGRLANENEDLGGILFTRMLKLLTKKGQVGLEPFEVANLKRTANDIKFYVILTMLMLILKHLGFPPDEKKENHSKLARLLYNQMTVLQGDVAIMFQPSTFESLTSKVIPATSVVTDLYKAVKKTQKFISTDYETQKKEDKAEASMWRQIFKNLPFARALIGLESRSENLIEDINK